MLELTLRTAADQREPPADLDFMASPSPMIRSRRKAMEMQALHPSRGALSELMEEKTAMVLEERLKID